MNFTEKEKKQYSIYRAEGLPKEKALALVKKTADETYNPALQGMDNLFFGENLHILSISISILGWLSHH